MLDLIGLSHYSNDFILQLPEFLKTIKILRWSWTSMLNFFTESPWICCVTRALLRRISLASAGQFPYISVDRTKFFSISKTTFQLQTLKARTSGRKLIAVHCVDYQWDVILKFVSYVDSLTRSVKAVNEMSKNENLLPHLLRSLSLYISLVLMKEIHHFLSFRDLKFR